MKNITWNEISELARLDPVELVFRSENYFYEQVKNIAEDIFDKKQVQVVMVAGPSSSGKTTFSKILDEELQEKGVMVHYIGLDDFFIDREKVPFLPSGVRDYDSPNTLDLPLVHSVIRGVLNNEWVEIPEYDFISGTRKEDKTILHIHPEDVVIIEGIHALNPLLIGDNPTERIAKVSIQPRRTFLFPDGTTLSPEELRLLRRTIRDVRTRGYDADGTADQWGEVRRAEIRYIEPYVPHADYFVDSAFDYELYLYKQCLGDTLDRSNDVLFDNIKKVMNLVENVPITDIPDSSLLNEFAALPDEG